LSNSNIFPNFCFDFSINNSINYIYAYFFKLYYDWSKGETKIKRISVPNKGLKRKLSEHFTIYMIDEFRTSCLHYKTENRCENMYVNDKKGVSRKLHSVLTFKAENNRLGCINRDENATNNMIKIVKSYLKDKTRPLRYTRGYEIK
jgi:hypothetical protein